MAHAALSSDTRASTSAGRAANALVVRVRRLNCPNPWRRFADTTLPSTFYHVLSPPSTEEMGVCCSSVLSRPYLPCYPSLWRGPVACISMQSSAAKRTPEPGLREGTAEVLHQSADAHLP